MTHPFLIESTIREIFTTEDMKKLHDKLRKLAKSKRPIYQRVGVWMQTQDDTANGVGDEPVEKQAFGRGNFGTSFQLNKFLKTLPEKELAARCICHICHNIPEKPMMTTCYHVFCRDCISELSKLNGQVSPLKSGTLLTIHPTPLVHKTLAQSGSDFTECPYCQQIFSEIKSHDELHLDDDEVGAQSDETPAGGPPGSKHRRRRTEGADELNNEPNTKKPGWLAMCDLPDGPDLLPSAKCIAIKMQLLKWIGQAPTDKIVIFTQFTLMARIIGRICRQEKWPFVYFTGDMSIRQRGDAVQLFNTNPNTKIMIAGLKCGGMGLNLAVANRVISVE